MQIEGIKWNVGAAAITVMAVGLAFSQPAEANVITFPLTADFCSGTCGTPPFGTVTITDIGAGEVQVNVTLTGPTGFAKTGAGGMQTLLWNLSGTPTLTDYTDVSSNQPIVLASTTAGSIMADGSGTWQYAVNCPSCGGGVSAPQLLSPITFDVSATGLSTASFVSTAASNNLFFAADIQGSNGNTGVVGAPTAVVPSPEPTSLGILGAGLVALGLVRRRRKRARPGHS
jgi:hypothetical protein